MALVVPLWNQWEYTELFLRSLLGAAPAGSYTLILVDNGSSDGTAAGLRRWKGRLPFTLIRNRRNRGCAPAWNQGVKAALKSGARWIGVLNNDLVLSPGVFSRLIRRAEEKGWDLVSPGTREGELDYPLESYAASYTRRCFRWDAEGYFGWCFLVRAAAFRSAGLFDEGFLFGIGEDEDFARRLKAKGGALGVTGSAFVHHFGSKTLKALKREKGDGFEKANLQALRLRWGAPARRGPWRKLLDFTLRLGWRVRYGHLLKE